ncbi:MAG: hypothetical protein AUG80_08910 [Candidatus Rokubacteria bacterium 13_1_20CM_4_68_9]|nr:MAG: hypothetical protein AUG80_08910 [Candidatus Rokubacteria bacterium 13_1_20CM_4_68_9]
MGDRVLERHTVPGLGQPLLASHLHGLQHVTAERDELGGAARHHLPSHLAVGGIGDVAQLQHVGEDDDEPAAVAGHCRGLERCAHRRRIGVVGVVEDPYGPGVAPHTAALHRPRR